MPYLVFFSIILLGLAALPQAYAADSISLVADGLDQAVQNPVNLDGWLPLMLVLTSLLTAWCMNYTAPKTRALGAFLAGVGCLAVAVWFFVYVTGSGVLENPEPNQTPMDAAKPALLWIQGSIAMSAGLLLFMTAYRQSKNSRILTLAARNETSRYGRLSRMFHWTIAGLFIMIVPMGIFASMMPEDAAYRRIHYGIHESLGVLVFVLLIARLAWNLTSQRPALDAALKPIERKMAHSAHLALYFLMFALPVTGFVMTSYVGAPTLFFAWELQPLWATGDATLWGLLHKYLLPYVLYVVWGAHVLGALKHHYIDKHEHAFKRMVG